jgi:molybdate transport system permease protein
VTVDFLPFLVTARVAASSTVLVVVIGLPLARWLTLLSKKGAATRRTVATLETLLVLPLVLPPTTLGYFLLVILGRRSPIGAFFESIGHPLVFDFPGAVIASAVAAFPLFFEPARAAFESVDPHVEDAVRLLGASERFVFLRVALPLAGRGLLAGGVLAFARAVGDFGTTLMVAGSIPGRTQTVAIAIYEAVQAGEEASALQSAFFVSLFALTALFGARMLRGSRVFPGSRAR